MYLSIDVGGTKTLVGLFSHDGVLEQSQKFPTPLDYPIFVQKLNEVCLAIIGDNQVQKCAIAMPGLIDHQHNSVKAFGNLAWKNIDIVSDLSAKIPSLQIYLENDAKTAALSEASYLPQYSKVLYLTISTGIGAGLVVDGQLDKTLSDMETGQMLMQIDNREDTWEHFASGKAIVAEYGHIAAEITDEASWRRISHRVFLGLNELCAIVQPDAVVIGGGVGSHLPKFKSFLDQEFVSHANPELKIPIILQAKNPEQAVIYGCYLICKNSEK
jgi:predicted NBD/HSP70 family sugar kinase